MCARSFLPIHCLRCLRVAKAWTCSAFPGNVAHTTRVRLQCQACQPPVSGVSVSIVRNHRRAHHKLPYFPFQHTPSNTPPADGDLVSHLAIDQARFNLYASDERRDLVVVDVRVQLIRCRRLPAILTTYTRAVPTQCHHRHTTFPIVEPRQRREYTQQRRTLAWPWRTPRQRPREDPAQSPSTPPGWPSPLP